MRRHIRRRHDAHVRAHDVCNEHRAFFDTSAGGRRLLAGFASQVADVAGLLVDQKRAIEERRAATHDIRRLRRRLRAGAKLIVRVGRIVNLDETMSTMTLLRQASDADLSAYVEGLINRVSPHAEAFVAAGLPADLLEDLAGRVRAHAAAREAQATARREFTVAHALIRATQNRTDDTIRVLEALAEDASESHSEVLTKLRIARRVGPRVVATEETPAVALKVA